jgi:peptidyl-prolyl cis-trans isomerase C
LFAGDAGATGARTRKKIPMKSLIACLSLLAFVTGCTAKPKEKPESATAPAPAMPTVTLPADTALAPDAILVEVNGVALTGKDAETELHMRLSSMRQQVPPEQMGHARQQVLSEVVRQFIMKTLLIQEAERQKIVATAEDEVKAYDTIRTNLPPGVTVEQMMKDSPMGEKRMREEVTTGLRINKLLAMRFTNQMEVTDTEIDDFIEKNKERMTIPEHVQARHILISTKTTDDDKAKAEKKAKAEQLREKLVAGADFAQLATDNSDCPSKQKGGDLGKFGRGQMVKAFEDAAFGQKIGEVGPVVETQFGYHIIQVTDHKEAGPVPRKDVSNLLKSRKQQKLLIEYVEELKSKAVIKDGNAGITKSPAPLAPMPMPPPGEARTAAPAPAPGMPPSGTPPAPPMTPPPAPPTEAAPASK